MATIGPCVSGKNNMIVASEPKFGRRCVCVCVCVCVCLCLCVKQREESEKEALFVRVDERGGMQAGARSLSLPEKWNSFSSPAPYCLCQSSFFLGLQRERHKQWPRQQQDVMQMNTFTGAWSGRIERWLLITTQHYGENSVRWRPAGDSISHTHGRMRVAHQI